MSLNTSQGTNQTYNNADSFAMAFDAAWESIHPNEKSRELNEDEKTQLVLEMIKDHPFLIENPTMAKEVAKFRIRLLNLL